MRVDAAGRFDRLMEVLDPDVVLRVEGCRRSEVGYGPRGQQSCEWSEGRRPVRTPGPPCPGQRRAGAILLEGGRPVTLASFTIIAGKIVEIDVLMDPERLALL